MRLTEALSDAFSRLSSKEKTRYVFYSFVQTFTNFLDLIGILCFSASSVLIVRGTSGSNILNRFIPLKVQLDAQNLAVKLLFLGIILLGIKTALSFLSTYGLFNLLGKFQNRFVIDTFKKCQSIEESTLQQLGSTNLSATLVNGSEALALGILGAISVAISEIFLLTILLIPLVIWAPVLAGILLLTFGATSLFLHHFLSRWGTEIGTVRFNEFNSARKLITKTASLSKPLKVSGKIAYFSGELNERMKKASSSSSKTYLLQQIPKYAFELTVILIGVAAGIYFYSLGSMAKGAGTAVLLLGVSFRVLPALLRLQSSIIFLRTSVSESNSLRELLKLLDQIESTLNTRIAIQNRTPPRIDLVNLNFAYPQRSALVLSNINFSIPAGSIALVKGLSGSGKTTLIDLILGLKNPTSGVILFDGQRGVYPSQSYMAQDTILIDASLEENIALGEIPSEIDSTRVNSVVDLLGIDTFLKQGTSTLLHGSGDNLSGGQRQKIGLARCLYDNPLVLVLDEPTSSLDKESIEQIRRVISSQRHQMTIIIVTHSADFDEISDVTLNL